MNSNIFINESKLHTIVESVVIETLIKESLFEAASFDEIKSILFKYLRRGVLISTATIASISSAYHLTSNEQAELTNIVQQASTTPQGENNVPVVDVDTTKIPNKDNNDWKLAADSVITTVYNAEPKQCNGDFGRTACMFRLNLNDTYSHKIIAMERTFKDQLGIKFGDVVKIEGTGKYDGVWQVRDLMNKRFKGMKKIDILVPRSMDKTSSWKSEDGVKIYVLKDKNKTESYTKKLAPQLDKKEFQIQQQQIRNKK